MLNIYVHIPFCLKKCPYCDFFSVPFEGQVHLSPFKGHFNLSPTLYFGGGTPSILAPAEFERIVRWLRQNFRFTKNFEFSLEANPETVTLEKIKTWKQLGVNRISIGVQSFSDKFLKILGRVHTAKKSIQAINLVKKYFKNFNLDLMFGLPKQTLADFKADLKKALSFKPTHISVYQLTLEKGTKLWKLQPKLPDEETLFKMYRLAINFLKKHGFKHYEISNFCRPGKECRHNLAVWHFEPYLGFGPGAHSFFNNRRCANPKKLSAWLPQLSGRPLPQKKLMSEFMFLGLRCLDGIYFKNFQKLFNTDLRKIYSQPIEKLKKLGLIKISRTKIALTKKGVFLGNEVFQEFL